MQHGHGHAARKWICSTDMDMQRKQGYAAWTLICSMDMDNYIYNKKMDIDIDLE
jgi:hypothetical protein